MFTLNLLGGAAFHGLNGPVSGRAAHRRRVALLAILAVARGRTVGRERIIGLLWPEHRADAARHLLSESLYVLRKELGEGAFVSAGDEVGLNAGVVRSDVEEFEAAVAAGELEGAASLYRGPFLDGFFLDGAPEFERWAESERARLAALHVRAIECLATAREGEGRPQEAAEWWRRLVVLDPYNSRVGTRLMAALDAAGERAAALWFAETHVAFLRDELGVEPEDEFQALVERLRSEPVRVPPRPAPPPAPASEAPREQERREEVRGEEEETEEEEEEEEEEGEGEGEEADGEEETAAPVAPVAPVAPPIVVAPPAPPVRRGWRISSGALHLLSAAGLLVGLAGALLPRADGGAPEAPARPAYDPRRVAVLYFDDYSRGGELEYLANGLTEALIHDLSQVPALQVVSRNGVKAYRDRAVPFDTLAADLRAGSVVEGSVQGSGDSVRVTVQLVDANTGAHLESRTLVHAVTGVFALEDALADSVSRFLRRRLGREVERRRTRAETRSDLAWRRVLEAERALDEAAELLSFGEEADLAAAAARLRGADSLLAQAERADPAWARPAVLRGWAALRLGAAERRAGGEEEAMGFAERALRREPESALARELRGYLLFSRATSAVDSAGQARRLDDAERDLRAAVAADPTLATAWNRLSILLKYRGRTAESDLLARRALEADPYLAEADDILSRLFFSARLAADHGRARAVCAEGRGRFPRDWRFVECALLLLRSDTTRPPEPAAAMGLLGELERMDPPERARRAGRPYTPLFRQAVAAAVLARAGERDSAQALLARARAAAGDDPALRLSLAYDEAYVHLMLGHPDSARALLEWTFSHRPAQRAFAARDPLFSGLAAATPRAGREGPRASSRAPSRHGP